jgi:hypothetical protein
MEPSSSPSDRRQTEIAIDNSLQTESAGRRGSDNRSQPWRDQFEFQGELEWKNLLHDRERHLAGNFALSMTNAAHISQRSFSFVKIRVDARKCPQFRWHACRFAS